MTKREICERLLDLRDYVMETDTYFKEPNLTHHNFVKVFAKDLRDLILDISASEEEEQIEPNEHRPQRWPEYETPSETPSFGENTQETR